MVLLFKKVRAQKRKQKKQPVIAKKHSKAVGRPISVGLPNSFAVPFFSQNHKKRRLTLIFGTFCDSIVYSLYVLDNCVVQLNTEVFDFCKIMGTEP